MGGEARGRNWEFDDESGVYARNKAGIFFSEQGDDESG
jgi:hypothetical protein